jgi:molybdenum cofactor biosynthesis enzyme MoaA
MGIKDSRGRDINYARISVTDRCNYRCVYCMPEEGVKIRAHADIMRYEDIVWLSRILVSLGINLTMNVYSGSDIPAFRRHVTISCVLQKQS